MNADRLPPSSDRAPCRVVGIGASAGGMDAYSRLLQALPPDTGFAYLLIPHLSPTHPSQLAGLLARTASIPVTEAADGDKMLPDHGYVLPADKSMRILDGHLKLEPRQSREGPPTVIDACLASLAAEWEATAVGVVLSGTGSDGAVGLQAIKARGGLTYAQDFATAAYPGMPRSAVEAGAVDLTLSPEGIAHSLAELARSGGDGGSEAKVPAQPRPHHHPELPASDAAALESILLELQAATGVDFRHYKRPSMGRRIRRRVEELGLPDLAAYAALLQRDGSEVRTLFNSVLIHVTGFFREPAMFGVLRETVIPSLLTERTAGAPLRVWIVGCASGEEAYSTAIAFLEVEAGLQRAIPVKIFASDLSGEAVAAARVGRYPAEIAEDVSAERLRRFFVPVDGGFQVEKRLREMCLFAQQDVTRDPPFANLDLVICRNLLIYLEPVLQRRVLHALHYALRPGGFLALGAAETVSGEGRLFAPLDRKNKVYLRRPSPARLELDLGWRSREREAGAPLRRAVGPAPAPWTTAELQRAAAQALYTRYPSGSVIVSPELEIRHFQGRTSPYLEPPSGGPTVNLLKMAHPDLRLILGRLVRKVQKEGGEARRRDIRIKVGPRIQRLNLSVLRVPTDETDREHFLVVFESLPGGGERDPDGQADPEGKGAVDERRQLELEQELAETRDYLQAIIEQQDETHAELQASYEASLSANEEFQSTNEELESTKEELQSVNEELTTVNEQLQQTNSELNARASEISGLLEAMDMPIVLLSPELRLQAFNARAAGELHLARTHLSRHITEIQSPLPLQDLQSLVDLALAEHSIQEREFQDREGRWYALRIWPVVPAAGRPSAVVAALVDIGRLKQDVVRAAESEAFHVAILEAVSEPLVVLGEDLRVVTANQAFYSALRLTPDSVSGDRLWELDGGVWDTPELRKLLGELNRTGKGFDQFEVTIDSPRTGRCVFQLSARRVDEPRGIDRHILLALVDVTRRKAIDRQMIEAGRMQAVGQLAGGVAHEINNQMTSVLGFADLLSRSKHLPDPERADLARIIKAAGRAADITRQLLAFSRRQLFTPTVIELNALVAISEGLVLRTLGQDLELDLRLGENVGQVRVDQAQFEQILVNLASNARDAMVPGGRLTIETALVTVTQETIRQFGSETIPRGTYARLIVRDSGAGMNEATLARIFEPFFTTKPTGLGTGLGLASVYGTVKQSGGYIWVESREGGGTTFTIDLPQAAASEPEKAPLAPTVAPRGSETILVVEDEEPVRAWLARALEELGYTVVQASRGSEALQLIQERGDGVALVISDVVMPGMGGAELLTRLAGTRPDPPVLLMSAYSREELYTRGIVDRDARILSKPFDIAELGSRVRTLLDAPTGADTR